jgi:hypothetical protein
MWWTSKMLARMLRQLWMQPSILLSNAVGMLVPAVRARLAF